MVSYSKKFKKAVLGRYYGEFDPEPDDNTMRACEHEEDWMEPHVCPVLDFLSDDSPCVCCEDCEYECYIETP